jgi:hypothetical protein
MNTPALDPVPVAYQYLRSRKSYLAILASKLKKPKRRQWKTIFRRPTIH